MCTAIGNNDPVPLQGRIWPAAAFKDTQPRQIWPVIREITKKASYQHLPIFRSPMCNGTKYFLKVHPHSFRHKFIHSEKATIIWFKNIWGKVENTLKGILDSIPSPSPSVKIQIMGRKVCLRFKGKTLLDLVNKLLKTKNLLTTLSNILSLNKLSCP